MLEKETEKGEGESARDKKVVENTRYPLRVSRS